MVNISKPLKSQQVHTYHKHEYANASQRNYYTEESKVTGHWHDQLAEEMGLKGPISSDHLLRLADGQHPLTGEQLVRHRFATETTVGHRAGWDATFSAPKSVSVTALVGGDRAVVQAHREARQEAIDYLERHTHARIGGNHPPEHTGKWVAAVFEHDTSRPVNGFCAPQLHDHVVFFNVTTTPDGEAHALQPQQLFDAQKTATAVYQARLGYKLRELGYDIEIGKNGAPEIKGYSPEYLERNSSRSEAIDQVAEKLMKDYGLSRPEARQRAAHSTREKKTTKSAQEIRGEQLAVAKEYGNQHEGVLRRAQQNLQARRLTAEEQNRAAMRRATKALSYAMERQFEREAVVKEMDLIRDSLRQGRGQVTLEHVEHLIAHRQNTGRLLLRDRVAGHRTFTTPEMVSLEKDNIRLVEDGKNKCRPLLETTRFHHARFAKLNPGQQTAAEQLLASTDQVQALQGAAGTGKTTLLQPVVAELKAAGYACEGLAPTSRAAKHLQDAGIHCSTLQKYLLTKLPQERQTTVYFLDETSLASSKQVNQFLTRLGTRDRVILIGDVRQHESVEAGRVFAQLQEHGISTARLEEIVRQRQADPGLREAVGHIAKGDVRQGFHLLQQQHRVIEIRDEQARYARIAEEYQKAPKETLVISADNRSRAEINAAIHDRLKVSGQIEAREYRFNLLVENQDVTGADRKLASSYGVGNVLRYNTGERKSRTLGIKAGDYTTVNAVNPDTNELTVITKDGRSVTYNPERFHGVSIFRPEERAFAVGERVQFTAPTPDHIAVRRDLGHITRIHGSRLSIALDSGRALTVDTNSFRHLDHGYAVTSYSSQSLTYDKAILNVDVAHTNRDLLNKRHALVAATREKQELLVFTDNAAQAPLALTKDVSKSSAIPSPQQSLARTPPSQTNPGGQRLLTLGEALIEVEQGSIEQPRHAIQQHQGPAPQGTKAPQQTPVTPAVGFVSRVKPRIL
jgi:conjugative relaxase-like TrwC/TraI family protein